MLALGITGKSMVMRQDEELTYLSHVPAGVLPTVAEESRQDEANYDTIKHLHTEFHAAMDSLHNDFNAFDIHKDDTNEDAKDKLLRDIDGRQIAFEILSPLVESLDNAMNAINKT
jgi:hypothetical protein